MGTAKELGAGKGTGYWVRSAAGGSDVQGPALSCGPSQAEPLLAELSRALSNGLVTA
jgi:hypothetical protein